MSDKRPATSWQLGRNGAVVCVIDVQEKLAPVMDATRFPKAVANVQRLLRGAAALEVPAIVTEQHPKGLGPTIGALTEDIRQARLVTKTEFDASRNAAFNGLLDTLHAKTVILAGLEAHICVLQTAVALRERFNVWVAGDAICSRAPENIEAAQRLMSEAGVVVAPTESILFGMLERSDQPVFKAVSAIVR